MVRPMLLTLAMPLAAALTVSPEGRITIAAAPTCNYADHKLWYRVCRPELLHAVDGPAPLMVLHGGPQVPSDYLFDLEAIEDRAVIFYDQLGCGRSDAPNPGKGEVYSVANSVRDAGTMLRALGLQRYHLYGQSWGGLLAAELVSSLPGMSIAPSHAPPPLSLTLSNTPTSVALAEEEASRLVEACGGEQEAFMAQHNLRVEPQPQRLVDAYAHAGTLWRGTSAIKDLVVSGETMGRIRCPALVLRGEHDFVTEACVEAWRGLPDARFETLAGCSHHALLEQPKEYLQVLGDFLREHE